MKTLLVPTDFSECANNALEFAAFVAKKTGATITLLHVTDAPPREGALGLKSDVHEMMGALMALKKVMAKTLALPVLKGIEVKDSIEVGVPHAKIVEAAKKHKADMIIMGTHGASGLEEMFIGSNAEKVVRNSTIPVISVKNKMKNLKIDRIVFATDFSEEAESVYPFIKEFADLFSARVDIVKVITPESYETTRQLNEKIDTFAIRHRGTRYNITAYNDMAKQDGIRHFADSVKANIVALGTHGRHGLARFFDGRITENLVNHATLPVLTINIGKKAMAEKNEKAIAENKRKNTKASLQKYNL